MEKFDIPGAQKALRKAQLYGYLVARHGRLHHPGGNHPLCGVQSSKDIVRSGWLRFRSGKYEITPEGLRALGAEEPDPSGRFGNGAVDGRRTAESSSHGSRSAETLRYEAQALTARNFDLLRAPAFWFVALLAVTPIVLVVGVILLVQQ